MNIKKQIIPFIVAAMFSASTVSFAAETQTVSYKAEYNGESINIKDSNIISDVDNSDLVVNVVKQEGNVKTTIFSGKLKDYDNGAWVNIDFSEIKFAIILNLDTLEDETICIIPVQDEKTNNAESIGALNNKSNTMNTDGATDLTCNINLAYGNGYYEKLIKPNEALTIPMTFNNDSTASKNVVCYIAEYDNAGKLTGLTTGTDITIPQGTTQVQAIKTFSSETEHAKLFFWEKDHIKPIDACIELNTLAEDYYGDTFESAQAYGIDKIFYGSINGSEDVDYIKFTPNTSGQYIISSNAENTIEEILYDEQKNIVQTGNAIGQSYYIKADLSAGQTYYLKTSGAAECDYAISICMAEQNDLVMITNDGIRFTQESDAGEAEIKLLDASGSVLESQHVTPINNRLTTEFALNSISGEYQIAVFENNLITTLLDIDILSNTKEFDLTAKDYISVPVNVSNASNLKDIYFSAAFDKNALNLYDACEQTYNVAESGTGIVSSAEINIKAMDADAVVFTSTKNLTQSWSGTVNTVKLQAVKNGTGSVTVYTYRVR